MTEEVAGRRALVVLLKEAYSGEMAAALAYRGHWKSLRDPRERETVARIEREEWEHRRIVGEMLAVLEETPIGWKEVKARLIGHTLGPLCHVTGHFLPMFFAWKLEVRNVKEYDAAAANAVACGHPEFLPELKRMADVEREHERFFAAARLTPGGSGG